MKRSNLEVGLRVILKKNTSCPGVSEFIGQEFTISQVEREDYTGELTVAIDGPIFAWCSHRNLKRVKVKPSPRPFEVGDKVRVINNPNDMFPVGTIGTITADDGIDDPIPFKVAADDGGCWYYRERDIELYVEEELPWPWPKGTPVTLTGEGRVQCGGYLRSNGIALDTPLFLGSDGSNIPPLETADGQHLCYVDDTYVKRK